MGATLSSAVRRPAPTERSPLSHNENDIKAAYPVERIAALYSDSFQKHGASIASLGYPKGAQDVRFRAISQIGTLENTSILDVGCGFGHMLDYLRSRSIKVRYTGVDITEPMIDTAKQQHPEADFRLLNILDAPICERWDWVFLIGAFNATPALAGWWEFVQVMMRRMWDLCKLGIAADFLSSYVDFQKPGSFHVDPAQVFSFAKSLTRRVSLRHDYMAYEFMVYLYRDQRLSENNAFIDAQSNAPDPARL